MASHGSMDGGNGIHGRRCDPESGPVDVSEVIWASGNSVAWLARTPAAALCVLASCVHARGRNHSALAGWKGCLPCSAAIRNEPFTDEIYMDRAALVVT